MKEIGGFFELELPKSNKNYIHSDAVAVNSGRHALEYILRGLPAKPLKLWMPFYTCEVVLLTIQKLNIPVSFYHVNLSLEIQDPPILKNGEYLIANNYYGIKDEYILKLASQYGDKLIVDNAQAWYFKDIPNLKTFYSPKKFFGVPDGGLAYTPYELPLDLKDYSYDRFSHLIKRIDINASVAHPEFKSNSRIMRQEPLKEMSNLTKRILSSIEMEKVREKRIVNFNYLNNRLNSVNKINIPDIGLFECPMSYPLYVENKDLRPKLIRNKIYIPLFWHNTPAWCKDECLDVKLTNYLLSIPIDQRYDVTDMKYIVEVIQNS